MRLPRTSFNVRRWTRTAKGWRDYLVYLGQVVTNKGPIYVSAPVISGILAEGETVTVSDGTWKNDPTFTYQWYFDGEPIEGATDSTFEIPAGSDGKRLSAVVTATNDHGTATATANNGGMIAPADAIRDHFNDALFDETGAFILD